MLTTVMMTMCMRGLTDAVMHARTHERRVEREFYRATAGAAAIE